MSEIKIEDLVEDTPYNEQTWLEVAAQMHYMGMRLNELARADKVWEFKVDSVNTSEL